MNKNYRKPLVPVAVLTAFIMGAGMAWWVTSSVPAQRSPLPQRSDTESERTVLYWYDPMYPQQRFDQPGKSPFMDMALVPKYADASDTAATVSVDARVSQNLGMRVVNAVSTPKQRTVVAIGRIAFNERAVTLEQLRAGGFVERAWPLAVGDMVRVGQPLVELRIPEWTSAQLEWLAVQDSDDASLQIAARERLLQLGLPETQLRTLERTRIAQSRFVITVSREGVLTSFDVRPGMTLMPAQTLAQISGTETMWLDIAVPEAQATDLKRDEPVEVTLSALPGTRLSARIQSVLPTLQMNSRSLTVRLELINHEGKLRAGMSAEARLQLGGEQHVITVPTEAIIRTGRRNFVMLADAGNRFAPTEVTLGIEIGDRTEIIAGVVEGQPVVVSGQFLLDSEANIAGVLAPADANPSVPAAPTLMLHEADAVVQAIDDEQITLAHGPFTSLGMPGMTMTFALAEPTLAAGIAVGDHVRVGLLETTDSLIVAKLEKHAGDMGEQP